MSLVSVIIPCFNQARFLKDAIRSVLAQTHSEVEIIVVNDGSTDDTETVALEFLADPRCKYVYQENHGLPAARNRGISESRGVYLNFLDADDWLEPTKIEEQASVLDDCPEIAWVYCDIVAEYEESQTGNPLSVGEARKVLSGDLFGSLLVSGYFPPHTVMIRRSVLDKVGSFDPDLGGHADYDLWLRVAGSGHRAYYLDKELAHYRVHSNNMSKNWEHMRETRVRALRKAARLFPDQFAHGVGAVQQALEDAYLSQQRLDKQCVDWQTQAQDLSSQLAQREQEAQDLSSQLTQVKTCTGWRMLEVLWSIRLLLAPRGSRRERIGSIALQTLGGWRRDGLKVVARTSTRELVAPMPEHSSTANNGVGAAKPSRLPLVLLAAVILVLGGIDVWWLATFRSGYPLTIDEAGYIHFALSFTDALRSGGPRALWQAYETGAGFFAPLVPLLTVPMLLVFGERLMASIAGQVVFFALLVVASYGLGKRLTSSWGGLVTAVVVASIPAVTDFARSYYFVILSAVFLTCSVYAQLQSDGLLRRRWAVMWGLFLGLTLLSRTMMVAFLPSTLVAALLQVVVGRGEGRRRLANLTIGLVVAGLAASTWYLHNWGNVFGYLTSYGYGGNSAFYNHGHSYTGWEFWTNELIVVTTRYLYVPLAALLVLCSAIGLVALAARHRGRGAGTSTIASFVRSDVFVLVAVLAEGYLALSSTQNEGTGFWVPLFPCLVTLSVTVVWRMPWQRLRLVAIAALVIVSGFNVVMKADVSVTLAQPRVVNLPLLGAVAVTNGHSEIQSYMDVAAHRKLQGNGRMLPVDQGWLAASTQLASWVSDFSASQHRVPVVLFGSRDPLFNTNTLGVMTQLYWHTSLTIGQLDASINGDNVAAYRRQLSDPAFGQPNFLVTSNRLAPGEFPPHVTQSYAVEAAQSLGFQLVYVLRLPDGREVDVWWLDRGPVIGERQ